MMKNIYGLMTPDRLAQLRKEARVDDGKLGRRSALSECVGHIDALEGLPDGQRMTEERLEHMRDVARGNEQRGISNSVMHEILGHIDALQDRIGKKTS